MKKSYTPGPWQVQPLTGYTHRIEPKAISPEEHCANSRLIAVAPEMLEMLLDMQDFINSQMKKANDKQASLLIAQYKKLIPLINKAKGQ